MEDLKYITIQITMATIYKSPWQQNIDHNGNKIQITMATKYRSQWQQNTNNHNGNRINSPW